MHQLRRFVRTLLESELFGYEKGAFTGADRTKTGLLEAAAKGTVFLDEIGDMPVGLQTRLLRAIENRKVTRVGGLQPRPIDVRFIAATNRDLEAAVASQTFRADLYFRLNGISLTIPPLRERRDEIEPLARQFLADAAAPSRRRPPRLTPEALAAMQTYPWPGNIRELRNMMERALVLCEGSEIGVEHLPHEKMQKAEKVERVRAAHLADGGSPLATVMATAVDGGGSSVFTRAPTPGGSLPSGEPLAGSGPISQLSPAEEAERQRIVEALDEEAGNQTHAAARLGISRGTLIDRIKKYRIRRPRSGRPA